VKTIEIEKVIPIHDASSPALSNSILHASFVGCFWTGE
jgi:hypothetical protein